MGYNDSQLTPSDTPIYGFNHVECKVEGAIQLPVIIGEEPREATQMLNFQVVKAASTYNAIMGRTGIHTFKAVPSTYHMVLKFPTRNGVGEARGDQKMARSCYVAALRPDGTWGQVLPIEDMDDRENDELRGKPAEDLVPIPLDPLDLGKVTYIGASLDKPLKGRMTTFLQENNDVFAWTAADMPGIDPNLITHRLNVDPTRKAVKQKRRTYAPNRLEAIKQEVEKLLEAGFIEEVQFPECLSNPVMVKKANGKWRMCIDFTDLNDACPKDFKSLSKAGHISHLREAFEVLRHHKMMLNPAKCAFGVGSRKFLGHMVSKRGIEVNPDKIKAILDMEPPRSIKDVQKLMGRIAALGRFISKSGDKSESQEAFEQLKKYMNEASLLAKPSPEDTLYLYLAVSEQAVRAVLVKE
ncbi:uncharacterized protein LOC141662425 [Apium graveolens]|uniref:uncharacterized protein LOC141662425 n=1 Tax=Apium graveolens TaxID=4045 RepID=UPI003D7A3266